MSDIYSIRQRIAEQAQAARAQAEQGYSRVRQGIADALEPRYTRQEELRNKYEWLPPQPTWQYEEYEKVLPAIAESEDPEAMMTRFNMALYYSTYFERPLLDTFENLEFYHEQWMGTRDIPKTYGKALADSFASGFEGIKYGFLGFQQMLSGGEDLELQFALEDSRTRMEELQDKVPRRWYKEAIKFGFQSVPYTGTALALSAISGGLAGGVAAGLGAPLKVMAVVKAGAAILANAPMMQGAEYADLRQQGVRHDIAAPIAAVSGVLQSAIEMTLGDTAAIAGNALKQAAPALTSRIVNKLFISGRTGALGRIAMAATKYAGEALEEGVEEALQQITSITALEIAKNWQGEGVDTRSAEEYGKEIAEAFRGGLLASLVMGVPSGLVRGRFALKEARELAALAKTTELPTFIREAKALNPQVLVGANAAQQEAILTETWNAQQARKTAANPPAAPPSARQEANPADLAGIMETTDLDPGTESQGTEEEPTKVGAVFRTGDGKLYTQFSNRVVKGDTSISGIYKVGDGSRETSRAKTNEENPGNRYGYISYTEDGERVTINEFVMDSRREHIRDEFFRDFAAEFSGKEIVWDPQTEEGIAIKERLAAANPDGPGAGLSYYGTGDVEAARARQDVSAKIERYFPRMSANERSIAVDLLEARASVLEMSLADYTSTYFADGMISDQSAENMDGKKGAVSFTSDVKALIYTTQTADFSTWVHENAHIFRRQLAGDLLTKAEAAFGVQDGVWDRTHEEAFAQGFEDYLREGKAPSAELQTLFGKMAAFLKRIYQNLKNRVNISPEIREVYDALLAKQESGVKPATSPAVKSNATTERVWNDAEDLPAPQPSKGYMLFQDETEEVRNTPSRNWTEHFPKVTHFIDTENKLAKPWKELAAHPDYDAAKNHEDLEAGKRLILDLLKGEAQQKQLEDLGETYPDAIVVPIHAVEEKSRNRIPYALAAYISHVANLELEEGIVQINKVSRTGKGSWYRFVFRPKFEGDVKQGRKYILVDDVFSNGGAFSELRRYIEMNGGEVVHMAAMATGGHGEQIALTEKTRLALEKKFGVDSLQQFLQKAGLYGGNYQSLTEPEGYALLRTATLDEAGNRILEAGREGNGSLLPGSVQGREAGPLDGILEAGREGNSGLLPGSVQGREAGATLFQSKAPDEQIADVRALYEGTPQWMKAPNGENTRLTEKQWLLVRTPRVQGVVRRLGEACQKRHTRR